MYNQVLNKLDFRAEKLGKVSLKNISKEIHAYEILSPNIEFDPNKDRPRPGILAKNESTTDSVFTKAEDSLKDNSNIMDDIRKAILEETRQTRRRLTLEECLERYGQFGPEAKEVIASMCEKGLIKKNKINPVAENEQTIENNIIDTTHPVSQDIGRAVEGIARAIEDSVKEWNTHRERRYRNNYSNYENSNNGKKQAFSQQAGKVAESIASRIEKHVDKVVEKSEKQLIKEAFIQHKKEVATGKWDADLFSSDHFKPGSEELTDDFSVYIDSLDEKSRKTKAGFVGNLISFIAVNSVLWYLNKSFSPGFLWAAIVTAGWLTGLTSNFFASIRSTIKSKEVKKLPKLDSTALSIYKKLQRVKDSMAMHFASILSVPPLLFIINRLTSPSFMWATIPAVVMGASFLAHLLSYPGTVKNLEKKLFKMLGLGSWKEVFRLGKAAKSIPLAGSYSEYYNIADSIKQDIVKDIKAGKVSPDIDKEMIPVLEKYVEQVKLLGFSINEIDGLVSGIPLEALAKDKEALCIKRDASESKILKSEYERSITEIDRQFNACKELEEQREILKLRLASSINALKQLKLDLARLNSIPATENPHAFEEIKRKAKELNDYMNDLKTGYLEAASDPFKELEQIIEQKENKTGDR